MAGITLRPGDPGYRAPIAPVAPPTVRDDSMLRRVAPSSLAGISSATQGFQPYGATSMDSAPLSGTAQEVPIAPMVQPMSSGANTASTPISQGQYENERTVAQKASVADEAFRSRLALLTSAQGPAAPGVAPMGGPGGDENAARAAAFARAKDQASATAMASLKALQNVMANSGRMGSSQEDMGTNDIISGAGAQINDFTRDQLFTDLNRSADVADRNYQGALTQRGQDMNARQSLLAILNSTGGLY